MFSGPRFIILVVQHPVLGTLYVVEFPFLYRPDKDEPAAAAETERQYDQYDQ
jgi:hypothetical protein